MPENNCVRCGAPLPTDALAGHCPRCLLLEGLDSDAARTGQGSNGGPPGLPHEAGSVLETIATTIGRVPRVLLRDTAPVRSPGPVVRPPGDFLTTARPATGSTARSPAAAWAPS